MLSSSSRQILIILNIDINRYLITILIEKWRKRHIYFIFHIESQQRL